MRDGVWRRFESFRIWAPAFASRLWIWNCAAPAICSAGSSRATWTRSDSIFTRRCSSARLRSCAAKQVEDETSVTINLGVDVAIPETYISDMGQRLRTYKRVSSARDEEALTAIRAETEDRYGRIPESVEQLFAYARLRQAAEDVGVVSIDRAPGGIAIKLSEKARVAPEKLMEMVRVREGASFTPSGVLRLELSEEERDEVLAVARRVLLQIRSDG